MQQPLATSTNRSNTTPPTTHQRVEPDIHGGTVRVDEGDGGGVVATIVLPDPDGRTDRATG
jgi:hypothetical protein